MFRILLMRPSSQSLKIVPTGLLYIAAFVRSRLKDIEVRVLDARANDLGGEEVAREIRGYDPDLVGISGMTFEAPEVLALARLAKREAPRAAVVLGGALATLDTTHLLNEEGVDYLCIGEGEETTLKLVEALRKGGDTGAIPGLASKRDGEVRFAGPRVPSVPLDEIPFPAYDLIDLDPYFDPRNIRRGAIFARKTRILPVFTSRGCPYRCTYCHNIHGKKTRLRSPEKVLEEIEWIVRTYRINELHICDDCFNIDMARAKRICDMIIEKRFGFVVCFVNGIRADGLDAELADKLKAMGTTQLCYGIESAVPRVLKTIKKSLDLESVRRALRLSTERDILTVGLFMLGFPGETEEEMRETIRFSLREPMHLVTYSHVIPFPGTELYRTYRERGGTLGERWRDFTTDSGYTEISLCDVPVEKIKKMIRRAYLRFFLNPRRIWDIFRLTSDKVQFLTHTPIRFLVRVVPVPEKLGRRLVDRFLYDRPHGE